MSKEYLVNFNEALSTKVRSSADLVTIITAAGGTALGNIGVTDRNKTPAPTPGVYMNVFISTILPDVDTKWRALVEISCCHADRVQMLLMQGCIKELFKQADGFDAKFSDNKITTETVQLADADQQGYTSRGSDVKSAVKENVHVGSQLLRVVFHEAV